MSNRAITAPPLVAERMFRGSGCDDRCTVIRALVPGQFGRSELLLHDTSAHEEYGAIRARAENGFTTAAVVATGGLRIDLDRLLVSVDGREIALTGIETRLMVLLARRVDAIVTHDEIAVIVWGPGAVDMPRPLWTHAINVHVSRMRRRLHPWEGLVGTQIGLGYRLRAVDTRSAPPPYRPLNYRASSCGWAIEWERCRTCGTTERRHGGKGDCERCAERRRKGRKGQTR